MDVKLLIIIKCFEHQFIPKHRIDRHSVPLHAGVIILKLQSGLILLDICVTSQSSNTRAFNKRLYGTIASHDEVWQLCIEVYNNIVNRWRGMATV